MKCPLLLVPAVLLAGCRLSEPVVCPAVVPTAVRVLAQDSVSGASVLPGASVVVGNSATYDSVVAPPPVSAMGAGPNRAGTYAVTVRQAGYRAWTKAGVKVEEGSCGARTVELVARLVPAP